MNKSKNTGSYGIVGVSMIALVLLIAVGINLLFGLIPENIRRSDLSTERLSRISDEAKDYLAKNLSGNINIYLVAESGMEDVALSEFLSRLGSLDERISVNTVDPTVKRAFLEKLTGESPDDLQSNTVIVQGSTYKSVKVIEPVTLYNYELFVIDSDLGEYVSYGEYPYREFISVYESMSDYFNSGYAYYEERFNGETVLISAIDYVLTDPEKLPKVYFTSLHGESSVSSSLIELLELSNLPAEVLKSRDEIPSDTGVIVINNPSNDITESEAALLEDYLKSGGKLFVITDHTRVENLKNLLSVLEKYGLSAQSNEIFETNEEYHMAGYANSLLPDISALSTAYGIDNYYFLARSSHSINTNSEGEIEGVSYTHLLKTSTKAYYEFENEEKVEQSDRAQFSLAVSATRQNEGEIVWFSCPYMLTDEDSNSVGGGNYIHFTAILSALCDKQNATFASKLAEQDILTINAGQAGFWAVILIAVIPGAVLIAGTIKVTRRKRS